MIARRLLKNLVNYPKESDFDSTILYASVFFSVFVFFFYFYINVYAFSLYTMLFTTSFQREPHVSGVKPFVSIWRGDKDNRSTNPETSIVLYPFLTSSSVSKTTLLTTCNNSNVVRSNTFASNETKIEALPRIW